MRQRKQLILVGVGLGLIILLGGFLRFYRLSYQSLWNDELSTWFRSAFASLTDVIEIGSRPDPHPPGYYVVMYFVQQWFGNNEFMLRLPSVIAGILSIPAMYALGKLLYSREVGLYAAALTAVLWCPIFYSQEARANSLLLLCSILSVIFWIKGMRCLERNDWRGLWPILAPAYILTSVAAAYLHHMGLFLVVLEGGYAILVFLRRRSAWPSLLLLYGLIVLLYLPWLREMFRDMLEYQTWIRKPGLGDLVEYGLFLFNYSRYLLLVAVAGLLFVAWREGRRLLKGPRLSWIEILLNPTVVLFVWLVGPVLIAFGKSLVSTPVFIYRNLIICLPAAYLLVARVLSLLPVRQIFRFAAGAALTAALVVHLVVNLAYYEKPTKQQFREAVQYIVERDESTPNAAILGYAWTEEYFNYYFDQLGSSRTVGPVLGTSADIPQLESYLAQEHPKHLWYIAAHKTPDAAFLSALSSKMTLVDQREFIGAHVWLWSAPSESR